MPIIKSKNNELLREVVYFSQQLKSIVKNGEIIMNDLTRVDLFTEIGIKRQILLLSGAYKVCDFLDKVRVSSETVALKNICFEIRFSDEFFVSIIITQEYLNAVNHYFGKGMRLSILNNSLFCESEAPILASYFYRAILNDIYDHSIDFEGVSFFVTNEVLRAVLSKKEPIFVSYIKIINYFGEAIVFEDIAVALEKFGYKVALSTEKKGYWVHTPFFRSDVYSENDILEDIMLFNIQKFKGDVDIKVRKRRDNNRNFVGGMISRQLLNFGFKELSLFSHKGMPLVTSGKKDYLLRSSIIPSLLNYEIGNQHTKYPHKIFEIDTVLDDLKQVERLGIVVSQAKVDFNELYSIVYSIYFNFLGKNIYLKESCSEYYEKGSSFDIFENKDKIGTMGILSLSLAKKIRLKKTCVCLEINTGSVIK